MSDSLITQARALLDQLDARLTALESPPPPPLVLSELQTFPWEDLWLVGRSKKWPAESPHGVAITGGNHPSVTDFHPIVIQGDSDNLYRMQPLLPRIPATLMNTMRRIVYSFSFGISDASACQAFEFECQRQIKTALWNMAYQLRPGGAGGAFDVFAFDYTHGAWRPTGAVIGPAAFTGGKMCLVAAEFTLSGAGTTHDAISFNGVRSAIALTQPATIVPAGEAATYFNVAWQPDATARAAPYKIFIDSMSVSLS